MKSTKHSIIRKARKTKRAIARKIRKAKRTIVKQARKIRRRPEWLLLHSRMGRRHSRVGSPKLWKMKRDFQIRFLEQAGLEPQHHLLDLGCGTLRGGIPIIEYLEKGHYFGVEARQDVLDEGRKELQESKLVDKEPTLIATADISSLNLAQEFDFIWAFSVLIHMEDKILYDALDFARRHLKDDGCFYANANVDDRADGSW
ncbi:MAG: class I SAM-dependent methyltransferase, partial [Gammaproteobacteria bacterium]